MKKIGMVTLISLIVAVIGVVAPILWDFYKTKNAIELQIISKATIVDSKQGIEKLSIIYDRKKIPSITKYSFLLINSGRSPILKKDLIDDIQISFNRSNEILEARVGKLIPQELQTNPAIDKANNKVLISFPLLNPADSMELDVFVSGSDPAFTALARIAGISKVQVLDKTDVNKRKFRNVTWPLLPLAALLLFCYIWALMFLVHYGRKSELKKIWENGGIAIPAGLKMDEYVEFVTKNFSTVMADAKLASAVKSLGLSSGAIDTDQHKIIVSELSKAIGENKDPLYASICFGIVGIAGTVMVFLNVI